MSKWLLIIVVVSLLGYAFVDSHTLEIGNKKGRDTGDLQYYAPSRTTLHWDRFFDYLHNVPRRIGRSKDNFVSNLDRMAK